MDDSTAVMVGLIIGVAIGAVIAGAIIWLVGKLNIGLQVRNFGWAMLAGLLIGILTALANSLIGDVSGVIGFVIHLVVSAVVILASGKILSGLTVQGFKGALFAAMAIAIINFVATLLLGSAVTA